MRRSAKCLVLAPLVLAACDAPDQSKTAAGGKPGQAGGTACSLLTKAEAEAALAEPVGGAGDAPGSSTASMCQYLAGDGIASVTLQLHRGAGDAFDAYVREMETSMNVRAQPVAGIGDKAVSDGDRLIVRRGQDFFIVSVGRRADKPVLLQAETELAQRVLGRL